MTLEIIKAKPNPAGKDRVGNLALQSQLAGEWVDIKNIGHSPVSLSNIQLYHWAYGQAENKWELVMDFSGSLPPGEIMRVHSSGKIPLDQLSPIDRQGADYHLFSGSGYVWNNDKEDKPTLWDKREKEYVDKTFYDAYPGEGEILERVNNKLV